MEEIKDNDNEVNSSHQELDNVNAANNDETVQAKDSSQNLFPDSPVYEPEDEIEPVSSANAATEETNQGSDLQEEPSSSQPKRKLSAESEDSNAKIQKLELAKDECTASTQALDNEVSEITLSASNIAEGTTSVAKRKFDDLELPSTSGIRSPFRSSPRRLKRSNSAELSKPKTPKTPRLRPASVDISKSRKTPGKSELKNEFADSSSRSRSSNELVEAKPPPEVPETIVEEPIVLDDSQSFHLEMSLSPEDVSTTKKIPSNSEPNLIKDRNDDVTIEKVSATKSEGYVYSDQDSFSQPKLKDSNLNKGTDQESTDSIGSLNLESPEHGPSLALKLIPKLSNGNSSTPTEISDAKIDSTHDIDSDLDIDKLDAIKGKRVKSESLKSSNQTRIEGHVYSNQGNFSQSKPKDYNINKGADQGSTDSVGSLNLDSPEHGPTVTSKLISKLSNGNSSTPTEISEAIIGSTEDSDNTPDMVKLNLSKGKRVKNESFRSSNNATPSTISPLPNGHSLPATTPQVPVFDIHINHNEDGEFLSVLVVRTDNDLGIEMCREYQRVSKRFTIDPYLGDISISNSPSSVTSGGMINLPNRTSFASVVSSTSASSNRTSDGAFVVPQPPRKSIANPLTSIKGHDALLKKLHDIFSHMKDSFVDEGSDEKISVGIQTSTSSDTTFSNGNASPEEVNKCDKVTPKSSLKKTRVRGRRHLAGKTKRALLPTQVEEPEYMHGMNSPEMVPTNGENDKSPKEEKSLLNLVATPKSVSKLKTKRRPTSPRPATPVEKVAIKTEYPGYPPDTVVLAKWVDKSYYSGKVLEITEPNKYLIKFDDGQVKVLLDDFIIFGDMKTLPLEGQSVYAMVDEEQNYEPGLVLGVEENDSGTVTYKCTTDGDTLVMVTASELYLTEDQARSLKESARSRSPSTPSTPRRRHNRELDLDNIIQGPRSARSRDKGSSSARKRVASPKSPKASTSGVKTNKSTPVPLARKRLASESSEMSESSNSAPPVRLEEVAGVEPEVQRTPRKIDGVKAGPLQLKGAAKQNIGKKNSKLKKFENDEDTVSTLGPIPGPDTKLFAGMHFLLTCTETPKRSRTEKVKAQNQQESRHYSSEEDSEANTVIGTDTEDSEFCDKPFNKERLKEQIETGGGIVYSHFDDVPKNKYSVCKLVAPRPCLTAKYIQCLAADIRSVSHGWIIMSCIENTLCDIGSYSLPAGWSLLQQRFIDWVPLHGKRSSFFKDKTILLCGDQDTFVKFWERVCTLAGANTRVVNEEDLNMSGAFALVTEWECCPHEVQNKANQDNIPLVSTTWVVQCLIEARVIAPTSHDKFSFMYTEPE